MDVTQHSSVDFVTKHITDAFSGAILALIGWVIAGSTGAVGVVLTALVSLLFGVIGVIFHVVYRRYLGVLSSGGKRKASPERQDYDELRESLAGDNVAARIYTRSLTRFLNGVDRFFGDGDIPNQTLFPHAFGLRTPVPLWTVPAFDRCLLLALFYPIATVLIVWAASGHYGPAEFAFHLDPRLDAWERWLTAGLVGTAAISIWRVGLVTGRQRAHWMAIGILLFALLSLGRLLKGQLVNLFGVTLKSALLYTKDPYELFKLSISMPSTKSVLPVPLQALVLLWKLLVQSGAF